MSGESWATSAATRRSMLGNRRTDTTPEVALRSALHASGFRFRKDHRLDLGEIKPRPDIVFTRAKVAVFVDGCYWHSCPQHATTPKQNAEFWSAKLARNVERDREHDVALRDAGWTVVRVWEHVQTPDAVALVVEAVVGESPSDRLVGGPRDRGDARTSRGAAAHPPPSPRRPSGLSSRPP